MAKNKSKASNDKREQFIITEQQRTSNPIFKTAYKRIRNLNKKLANIDTLKQLDQATLKPEQIAKLASRIDVQNQIKKTQQFAQLYKGILQQSGGISFDNSQDLIKIATLIAVGQNLDKSPSAKLDKSVEQVYSENYKKIANPNYNRKLVERIGDIFNILSSYLKDQNQYRSLQDYISYAPQVPEQAIEQKIIEKRQQKKQQKKQKVQQKKQQVVTQKRQDKIQKIQTSSENRKKQQPKKIEQIKEVKSQVPVVVEQITNQASQEQPRVAEKIQLKQQFIQKKEQTKQPEQIKAKENLNQKPEHKKPERGYNKNYKAKNYNYNHRKYDDDQGQTRYKQKKASQKDESNTNYRNNDRKYKERDEGQESSKITRKYETKKNNKKRRDSDTSLESTPQKIIVQKPKFVEKD